MIGLSGASRFGAELSLVCVCVLHLAASTSLADDAAARRLMREASTLASSGAPERAAPLFKAAAREATDSSLRRSAELNAALCAVRSTEASERDRAIAAIESVERSTRDPRLLGAARRALGSVEHGLGVAAMEESPDRAIEHLARSERWLRSALGVVGPDPEIERNIELTQRLIEALMRRQEQERSEQREQSDDQGGSPGSDKSQQEDGQSGEEDSQEQSDEGNGGQPNGSQPQNGSESRQEQGSSGQGGQPVDPKVDGSEQGNTEPQPGERDANGGDAPEPKDAGRVEAQQPPATVEPSDGRGFNPIAAQILDKERRERAAMERLMRQMQGRPARVERDW